MSWASLGTVGGSTGSYTDNTVAASTAYEYRVVATNASGETPSNIVEATTPAGAPTLVIMPALFLSAD